MYRVQQILSILLIGFIFLINDLYGQEKNNNESQINFIKYHNIDKAWRFSKGQNVKVAILDWMFNIKSDSSNKYINPTSLVPGQDIGVYDPWHGEWMAEIVHQIAPDCKIIPVRTRPVSTKNDNPFVDRPYEKYIIEGIKFAADHGAVAVTNSMDPFKQSEKLDETIKYAEKKGTVFIDVHPEYLRYIDSSYVLSDSTHLNDLIIHSGIVSVPAHPRKIDPLRDIYTWPYDINPKFKDGWGYSNGPPIVAGVVALMKSVNNNLTVSEIKKIIVETSRNENGFKVLDAEAAVKAALKNIYQLTY
ncbi:MAG: S8/S53 family peptidase [Chlorobi bacterium]|nr:S8/S53 family peptidase [Chlorobiota bacterium]